MGFGPDIIAVVTRSTRLASLKARWATADQAAFRLKQAVFHEAEYRRMRRKKHGVSDDALTSDDMFAAVELASNEEYEDEDHRYNSALRRVMLDVDVGLPVKSISRDLLPMFDFGRCALVVVLGQDGLVANTAKYVGDLPIVGVNPDPTRNDGVLLPFSVESVKSAVQRTLERKCRTRRVTLAEVQLNDGQRMLAFNDFFVGADSHVSARYTLEWSSRRESQSSSGVLVSTGVGSTGWLSSVFNMAEGIGRTFGSAKVARPKLQWEDRRLVWAVREPFKSRHSQTSLLAGMLDENEELVIASEMPVGGVIFSDGVPNDSLEFNSGTIARFGVSAQQATLVVD